MGRCKMMGAGSSCSTLYNCNVNLKTCGGNKKQGLAVQVDGSMNYNHRFIKTKAIGNRRDVVFTINQLGGVSSSSFSSSAHSHAIGNGIIYKDPFLCYPYCSLPGIQTPAQPLELPDTIETDPLIITQLNMFQYSNYDNVTHCYTDASQFKIPFQRVMIGNITLLSYLQQHYPGSTISPEQIIITFKEALLQEDKFNGTGPLFIDRVDKTLYSIPGKTGFKYGPSICSQLYDAMVKYYPERVITCPTRQTILQSGDSFSFVGVFVGTKEITINFNIQIQ